VAGLLQYRLWEQWPSGRFGELLVISLMAWAGAWMLRRFIGWSWASGMAAIWAAGLVPFAGPLPVATTLLLGLSSVALGGAVATRQSLAIQAACGLVLLGAGLGWLLPLPVHHRWTYLAVCVGLVLWRRRQLAVLLPQAREHWRLAVAGSPRIAAFAVLAIGLASTGCWLPTLQFDDLGYHLRLPWQLVLEGSYPLEVETHIWALAPWLADVLQAVPQVIGGEEARGPLNALWIGLTACGAWQLARVLGGDARAGWLAVALYASLPLTATLAGSMQTETPTAALLVWLVVLVARAPQSAPRSLLCGAILAGGLLGLKLAAAVCAVLLLPWALLRHWPPRVLPVLGAGLVALALGTSSYVYAGLVAGNPFLPLFNAWFRSPFMQHADFDDLRWHGGFDPDLFWDLTFDTGHYLEAFSGGGGFVLIALAGAWILAFTERRTAAFAVMAAVLLLVPLVPMQYLRYVFPGLVVLVPLLVVASFRNHPRRAAALLLGVCVLNFAFQANGHWMLRTGMLKLAIRSFGQDAPLYLHYAPERILQEKIRSLPAGTGEVLGLDAELPISAEMGGRGRTVSGYDPSLHAAALRANADPTGAAWASLLRREQVSDVLLRPKTLTPAQRAGLELVRAQHRDTAGDAQWWSIPAQGELR
jgi:hypothetical protein